MENERINSVILDLWKKNKYQKYVGRYSPLLFPEFNKGGILFIGLNPSLSEKGIKKILKGTKFRFIKDIKSFEWRNRKKPGYYDELIKYEKRAKERYDYFSKFRGISKYVFGDENKWEHIDLFFYRVTSSKELRDIIGLKEKYTEDTKKFADQRCVERYRKNESELNEFGKAQIEITKGIINEIKPKVIVVTNTISSRIFIANWQVNCERFQKEGFDRVELSHGKIPILFTSMLSGQRALDLESLRRLKWQIKKAVGK